MAENISSITFVTGITQGNGHGKPVKLPVKLFLRPALVVPATLD
jgi:hypothetical protein